MKSDDSSADAGARRSGGSTPSHTSVLEADIGSSIDMLVEYLVDNDARDIHPLIMGEVERRLIVKVLERSRGNKVQAAKWLGMNRNTFRRKMLKLGETAGLSGEGEGEV